MEQDIETTFASSVVCTINSLHLSALFTHSLCSDPTKARYFRCKGVLQIKAKSINPFDMIVLQERRYGCAVNRGFSTALIAGYLGFLSVPLDRLYNLRIEDT